MPIARPRETHKVERGRYSVTEGSRRTSQRPLRNPHGPRGASPCPILCRPLLREFVGSAQTRSAQSAPCFQSPASLGSCLCTCVSGLESPRAGTLSGPRPLPATGPILRSCVFKSQILLWEGLISGAPSLVHTAGTVGETFAS